MTQTHGDSVWHGTLKDRNNFKIHFPLTSHDGKPLDVKKNVYSEAKSARSYTGTAHDREDDKTNNTFKAVHCKPATDRNLQVAHSVHIRHSEIGWSKKKEARKPKSLQITRATKNNLSRSFQSSSFVENVISDIAVLQNMALNSWRRF